LNVDYGAQAPYPWSELILSVSPRIFKVSRESVAGAAPYVLAAGVGLYAARGQGLGEQLIMAAGMGVFVPIGAHLLLLISEYLIARIVHVRERDALPEHLKTVAAVLAIVALYGLAQRWQENHLERLIQCIQDEQTSDYGSTPITATTLRWCDQEYHIDHPISDLEL
jgi:hypothetical protein